MSRTSKLQTFVSLVFLVAYGQSLSFSITRFNGDTPNIINSNDTNFGDGEIQLTRNLQGASLSESVGRASYSEPMQLWDKTTNKITNFTTNFSFKIQPALGSDLNIHGDGMAFFLAPFDDESTKYAPINSSGGYLGLSTNLKIKSYPFVAVEFDTYHNSFDPDGYNDDHLGIDVSSVISKTTVNLGSGLRNNSGTAWISYDSSTMNLSVYLTDLTRPMLYPSLSYIIDLSSILPEKVRVGFSSTTGASVEIHSILSWSFNSTLPDAKVSAPEPSQVSVPEPSPVSVPGPPGGLSKRTVALVSGLVACIVVTFVLVSLALIWWRKRIKSRRGEITSDMDDGFHQETGPKRFTYNQLRHATNNFSEERKLGQGGFGGVYKGFLRYPSKEIAVKKIAKGSDQGRKEYISEIMIISQLRHKNLVQLLGWCHERRGELLLVYEYMPNGSLDYYLYSDEKRLLNLQWEERYKIAQGLASAVLYLHEDWEQCVLHRDIKPSNVMLDSNFNAKLGDFGIARLVDHNLGSHTTTLAGTLGYLAPECVLTGKASKESDVYSFGVVVLEIACGRQPIIQSKEESSKVSIIEWVWALYGEDCLLRAVDERLEGEFDIQQIKCLMIVGLWCCQFDHTLRPSIRQVINVLNFESPLPSLPMKLPVPVYGSASVNADTSNITTSSSAFTGFSSANISSSAQSVDSDSHAAPLLPENATTQ